MPTIEQDYELACAVDDAEGVEKLLSRTSNPRALYESTESYRMDGLAMQNRHQVIPVVARHLPDTVNKYNGAGMTPFHCAAWRHATEALWALADAGADVHALTIPPVANELPRDAMSISCTQLTLNAKTNPVEHFLTLRRLGLNPNVPNAKHDTAFSDAIRETGSARIKDLLHAGANLYSALRLPQPDDGFTPHTQTLHDAFANAFTPRTETLRDAFALVHGKGGGHRVFEQVRLEIDKITNSAPRLDRPFTPALFLQSNAEVRPEALQWEALSLLPLYFIPQAAPQWKGGLTQMVETAHRMPAYMHDSINVARTEREMPLVRTESITAAYISGKTLLGL